VDELFELDFPSFLFVEFIEKSLSPQALNSAHRQRKELQERLFIHTLSSGPTRQIVK